MVSFLLVAGCGKSQNALVTIEVALTSPAASPEEMSARIERRVRAVGGEVVSEVTIEGKPDDRYSVSVALTLPGRCETLSELRGALVEGLTRPGRLGFHRDAGEPGQRQLAALADKLPEGSLRRDERIERARRSYLQPEELRRAIAALPEVLGVQLALEDLVPEPSRDAAREQRIWALETPAALDNAAIAEAHVEYAEHTNQPVVNVGFDERGKSLFGDLSASLVNDYLVIVLDGEILSAPKVMEPIRGGRAMIDFGGRSNSQATLMEAKVIAGALTTPDLAARVTLEAVNETCLE
jgi:preprotein translocase subunit SecD